MRRLSADFLIVGSGIAGLRAAVALQEHGSVIILTKADRQAGSTGYAQGGIAAAVGPDDSPELHLRDTLAAGDGLCDEQAARVLVEDGPRFVRELETWGAAFDRKPDGSIDLAREGAHTVRRVLHARDATGREIGRVLGQRLLRPPRVVVIDHTLAVQALVEDGRVAGALFVEADGLGEIRARATLLATGGASQVFRESTNPEVATGDGVAMAFMAGARVADMEFVQFHPTALAVPGHPRYLLSEALRGEGAQLLNVSGEAFMAAADPLGDLAPRDRVARAIVREAERTGAPVYLSLRHLPASSVRARFPVIAELCKRAGLDLATDLLPVSPAAHYVMGGVETDVDGRSSLPGLYAAGEVACTGVHGANRLASNSLLEGLVFGGRAGDAMVQDSQRDFWREAAGRPVANPSPESAPRPAEAAEADATTASARALAELMWQRAGVFRDGAGLREALDRVEPAWTSVLRAAESGEAAGLDGWRLRTLVTVSRLILGAALRREESRGSHFRRDFPAKDDLHWKRRLTDTRAGAALV
jgi:L-aspartate oxidase